MKTLIVRDVPRKSLMLFLIANNPPASDLIPVEFPSKTEFSEWRKILQEAAQSAPSYGEYLEYWFCFHFFRTTLVFGKANFFVPV